jgi:DNA polymerase III epsilon subunit-like protein
VKDGFLVSRYSSLVDPGIALDPMITQITGITDEMLVGKPTIEQLMPSFYEFTEKLPLVAHNAPFDCRFLERDSIACGFHFDQDVFDTLSFARRVLPKQPSYKLGVLTELLGIPLNDAHRAWCDAEATARLYMILKAKSEE